MNRAAIFVTLTALAASSSLALADGRRDAILADFAKAAKSADANFSAFSGDRGKTFWFATQTGGKPDATSCTACHTKDPKATGQTRAGKDIKPMAVSKTADRFTDPEKVAKWFLRNCTTVLGRECTATEKGDVITFLASQ